MAPWYYDNSVSLEQLYDPAMAADLLKRRLLPVDRVYCFVFDSFTDAHWSMLHQAYAQLPRWQGFVADGCPAWVDSDPPHPPYLIASVESPGLHVTGVLQPIRWRAWDRVFRALTNILPRYYPESG